MLAAMGARVAPVAATALVILMTLLAIGDALEPGSGSIVAVLALGLTAVTAMLLVGLRGLHAVEAYAAAALDRAAASEATQRASADELATMQRQFAGVQRVQSELAQASKLGAVGDLAAAVAHEVNNPLTGILGFSELLLAELPVDDSRHEEVAVIREEAVRARSIVKALVEFARPRPPQRIRTNLNDLARSTLELVRPRASEAEVNIAADYGDVPPLEIDPDAFRQVLLNVFNNAIDAMPNGGELRIATIVQPYRVGVAVADVGIGMDDKTRARIFVPFFSTRAGNGGATGLGLSVSLQIVEGHGGTIEVQSAPGRGSVFTVWLPLSWPAFTGAFPVPGVDPSQSVPSSDPEANAGSTGQSAVVSSSSSPSTATAGAGGSRSEVAA